MQTEKTSPWLIAFRVIFTLALLACVAYIFRNSLQTGAQSSLRSQAAMETVNETLGWLHLGPLSEHTIRKLAHFLEFMMEGFFCAAYQLAAVGRFGHCRDGRNDSGVHSQPNFFGH